MHASAIRDVNSSSFFKEFLLLPLLTFGQHSSIGGVRWRTNFNGEQGFRPLTSCMPFFFSRYSMHKYTVCLSPCQFVTLSLFLFFIHFTYLIKVKKMSISDDAILEFMFNPGEYTHFFFGLFGSNVLKLQSRKPRTAT